MNYLKIYNDLIVSRKKKTSESNYHELHHIIPRYMKGTDENENLVKLTAREHFLAHWLLWKIYNDRKSALAFSMMKRGKNRKITSSREYAAIRESLSISQKGSGNHMYGKTLSKDHLSKFNRKGAILSEETKQKIGNGNRGKRHTEETKRKISFSQLGNKKALGHTVSEESREKIRKRLQGKSIN